MRETLVKTEDFKDSPLGEIPQDWDVKALGDCAFITKLAGFEYTNYFDYSQPGEIIAIRVLNIRNGTLDLTDVQSIPRKISKHLSRSVLGKGDLVISYVGTIGEVALIEENDRFHLAPNVAKISPNSEIISSRFLFAQLLSQAAQKRLLDLSTLTSQPALSMSRLRQLTIALPPVPEQRRIVEILETVDETIAHTSSLIAKLKQMKAGLLHDLLTRGLDENRELRDAIAHPEQFQNSPLGQIPKDWEVRTMEEITTKIVDGVHKTPLYVESGIPFLTVENLTAGIGISLKNVRYVSPSAHAEFLKRADPRPGDVLVSKDGTLGIARIVTDNLPEFSIFVSVAQLRPNEALVLPSFICTFFETGEYERQLGYRSAGTGLKHIHLEHFRAFQLAVPPIAEQHRISKVLKSHDTRIRAEEAYRDKLKLQKQGLMHDLLTGKVRVNYLGDK